MDNRTERWLPADATMSYEKFRADFGRDEFAVAAYTGKPLFEETALEEQLAVLERLEVAPGVDSVLGIPVVYRELFGAEHPEALREEMVGTPFYRSFLVSTDEKVGGLLIVPSEDAGESDVFVAGLRDALRSFEVAGWETHLAGPPVLNAALDQSSRAEAARTFPIAVLCSLAVLWLMFRDWRLVVASSVTTGVTLLLALAVPGVLGRPLNMLTAMLPPLVWVLSLSNTIHLLNAYRAGHGQCEDWRGASQAAMRATVLPCFLATVTTAAGFAALLSANMRPVRELGVFAAVGILLGWIVTFVLCPALLRVLGGRDNRAGRDSDQRKQVQSHPGATALCALAVRRPKLVTALWLALSAGAVATIWLVRVESDPLTFLPEGYKTVQDYEFVGTRLTGYYSMEVVVDVPGGWLRLPEDAGDTRTNTDGWGHNAVEVWGALQGLQEKLAAAPGVAHVLSPLDLLRKLHQWQNEFAAAAYRLPEDAAAAQALLEEADPLVQSQLSRLVTRDGTRLRLSVLVNRMPSTEYMTLRDRAEQALLQLPEPLTGHVTGTVDGLVRAQLGLVRAQVRSLGWAAVTVFLFIFAGLRSLRLGLLAVPPNLFPVVAVFAAMGLSGVALDPATVMTACIALGIAVDDTIHYLSAWRAETARGGTGARACMAAADHVTGAMIATTVVACIGFFGLAWSGFTPVRYFGLLSAVAMLVALAADLLLLPALLVLFASKGKAI
ncbi:MAG: MMPL family transporter [Candidatus Hydrogenedentes bacterium]|nr:MMPL family transporter [Candidatus Hydrogenedentota bacterium]